MKWSAVFVWRNRHGRPDHGPSIVGGRTKEEREGRWHFVGWIPRGNFEYVSEALRSLGEKTITSIPLETYTAEVPAVMQAEPEPRG